jgi:hypothetical protein
VDSLLLWQGYPNIGFDDKNQFEMTASLPGGLPGLKDLVSQVWLTLLAMHVLPQLQAAGVRVLLPYLPWDQLTHPAGQDHTAALMDQVEAGGKEAIVQVVLAGVDGINGDTMDGVGEEWWLEGHSRGLQVVLEPEVFFGDYSYVQVDSR